MHCKSTSIQIKMWIILVVGLLINVVPLIAQEVDLSLRSPYHTINAFLYYQEPDSYNPQTSALTLYSNESTSEKDLLVLPPSRWSTSIPPLPNCSPHIAQVNRFTIG